MRKVAISLLVVATLAACGSASEASADLEGVVITGGAVPIATVQPETSATETESKVVEDGGGAVVKEGDLVKVNYVAINGRTGKEFDSSYASGRASIFRMNDTVLPGFKKALVGKKIGSRVVALIPPQDGFDQARPEFDLEAEDSLVFVFDLVTVLPLGADGEPVEAPDGVPELLVNDDGEPTGFEVAPDAAQPTESSATVLIQGDGPEVEADQTVTLQFLGQVYPAGTVFDSSWTAGAPLTETLTRDYLIDCWVDHLAGQKVGSRVLLVCPPDTAFGDVGNPPDIAGGDTLIYAIDLLDTY